MSKVSLVVYGSLMNKVELQNSKIDILDYIPDSGWLFPE